MSEYSIRKAEKKDIPFLAEAAIAAEKGKSDKLSYSTLFNLPESKVRELLITMFEEELDGCELSLSSFIVVVYNDEPVAAISSWIEGFEGSMPSQIVKSNLINFTFDKESIEFLKTKSHIIKDILAERDLLSLQFEYLYITEPHLGKGLDIMMLQKIEELGLQTYPGLQKAQCQLFKNSVFAIKLLMKQGYKIMKSYKSDNPEIFNYVPSNEKYLIEKILKQ